MFPDLAPLGRPFGWTECSVDGRESAGLIGLHLIAKGFLPAGSDVVVVSINPDLTRCDANFLKIHRVYGIGLALSSLAAERSPAAAAFDAG